MTKLLYMPFVALMIGALAVFGIPVAQEMPVLDTSNVSTVLGWVATVAVLASFLMFGLLWKFVVSTLLTKLNEIITALRDVEKILREIPRPKK